MVLSWLYSNPKFRFKGKPISSLVVIGIGTSFSSVLMGYIAAGGQIINLDVLLGAIGTSFIIVSMYPFSQVYQLEEDRKRGDNTFAVKYGIKGVKRTFKILFIPGFIILGLSLNFIPFVFVIVPLIGIFAAFVIWGNIKDIKGERSEYKKVMKTKYYSGILFTILSIILLFLV